MSTLNVTNINAADGTSGLTVANTGIVTASKEIVETDYMIQQWRINAQGAANSGTNDFLKGSGMWEVVDNVAYSGIGNYPSSADMDLDISTGTFSFPRTGLYLVRFFGSVRAAANDATINLIIYATVDGGATNYVEQARSIIGGTTFDVWCTGVCETLVNVTNTTNVKVRFGTGNFSTGTYLAGSDTITYSGAMFERKGAAQ